MRKITDTPHMVMVHVIMAHEVVNDKDHKLMVARVVIMERHKGQLFGDERDSSKVF